MSSDSILRRGRSITSPPSISTTKDKYDINTLIKTLKAYTSEYCGEMYKSEREHRSSSGEDVSSERRHMRKNGSDEQPRLEKREGREGRDNDSKKTRSTRSGSSSRDSSFGSPRSNERKTISGEGGRHRERSRERDSKEDSDEIDARKYRQSSRSHRKDKFRRCSSECRSSNTAVLEAVNQLRTEVQEVRKQFEDTLADLKQMRQQPMQLAAPGSASNEGAVITDIFPSSARGAFTSRILPSQDSERVIKHTLSVSRHRPAKSAEEVLYTFEVCEPQSWPSDFSSIVEQICQRIVENDSQIE